jgi:uncharacterized OsmC-like protein
MSSPASPSIREYSVGARSTDVFGRVLCSARHHHFVVDGPVQNGCPGEELTPPEAFLVAVGSCGVELLQVIARDGGKGVGAIRVQVDGRVDRASQPHADRTVFNSVRLRFTVAGTDAAAARELVDGFKRR